MEGLILLGVYVVVASALEAMAVGIGFFTDSVLPSWSTIIFMTDSGAALWVSWPIAVWLTRNRPVG
jgi:hypothetical protein